MPFLKLLCISQKNLTPCSFDLDQTVSRVCHLFEFRYVRTGLKTHTVLRRNKTRQLKVDMVQNIIFLLFLHVSKSRYFFSNWNSNYTNLLDLRNLQEVVKKNILLPKIVLTFHCLIKIFANSWLFQSLFTIFSLLFHFDMYCDLK